MKKSKLKKIIASTLIAVSVLALNPIGASASWRYDGAGWWYTEGTSWAVGWRQIDGKWYYFDSNGHMVKNTNVGGYALGSDGAWIQNNVQSSAEVQNLVYEQESNNVMSNATSLNKNNESYLIGTITDNTDIDCYKFTIDSEKKVSILGSIDNDSLGLTNEMNIGIYDSSPNYISSTSSIVMDGKTSQLLSKYKLPAGTYYIVIAGSRIGNKNYKYLWDNNKYGVLVKFE